LERACLVKREQAAQRKGEGKVEALSVQGWGLLPRHKGAWPASRAAPTSTGRRKGRNTRTGPLKPQPRERNTRWGVLSLALAMADDTTVLSMATLALLAAWHSHACRQRSVSVAAEHL